ncbi:MAG: hypothetical protein WC558_05430 [Patulibacter sp.]
MGQAARTVEPPRRGRVRRAALTAVAATAALGLGASAASAETQKWGYEQISPADSTSIPVFGVGVSDDLQTAIAGTVALPLDGQPADGRNIGYYYGLPRYGAPWSIGPVDSRNGNLIPLKLKEMSADGSSAIMQGSFLSVDPDGGGGFYRSDPLGVSVNMSRGGGSQAFSASDDLDTVASFNGTGPVSVSSHGQDAVPASLDNDGAPMTATALGSAESYQFAMGAENALSADGSSVIFASKDRIPGDNDEAGTGPDGNDAEGVDLFRRTLTPGSEQTVLISDANGSGDADASADAAYNWATADHQRIFFTTPESLEPGDTDGEADVYLREGTAAPVRISQGEPVDGSPTGNGSNPNWQGYRPTWAMSSEDGNRTLFVTAERLTPDAPEEGAKLYERDLAEGRTRFVAGPLVEPDVTNYVPDYESGGILTVLQQDLSLRGIRSTANGAVFMSKAPLAGTPDDGLSRVFSWSRDGGLVAVAQPDADAPDSPPARSTIMPINLAGGLFEMDPIKGARAASDDGSRVFFTTAQSLTAEDTDGGYDDVYAWTAGEGLRLVSPPGRAHHHAGYIDSSPDGTQVFFGTAEGVLASDTDPDAEDIYMATLGGGAPPTKPAPDADPQICAGDACQGPVGDPVVLPSIGSVGFAGTGNLLVSPDPVRPSVSVGKLKAVTGSAATLKVRVPTAGRISVSGSSLRKAAKSASKAGTYKLKVSLTTKGRGALKKQRTLKVRVRIAYRTSDGRTASKTVSVTFKQPKVKKSATTKKGGR